MRDILVNETVFDAWKLEGESPMWKRHLGGKSFIPKTLDPLTSTPLLWRGLTTKVNR